MIELYHCTGIYGWMHQKQRWPAAVTLMILHSSS